MTRFRRVTLRTPDVAGARAFYTELLGRNSLEIGLLPEEAKRRGARSLWLGQLEVGNVEAATSDFMSRGAVRLGSTRRTADGGDVVILRDPGGAVVAMTSQAAAQIDGAVVWYHLNTRQVSRAIQNYQDLFGWHFTPRSGSRAEDQYHEFAWRTGEPNVGSIADIAGRPGVHPHWLFHFQVASLEHAASIIWRAGGLVVGPMLLPDGQPIVVSDDPWGATFALRKSNATPVDRVISPSPLRLRRQLRRN